MQKSRSIIWLPLKAWLAYSVFTIGCFQFGFREFGYSLNGTDYIVLYGFLLACHVAVAHGFSRGVSVLRVAKWKDAGEFGNALIYFGCIANILLTIFINARFGLSVTRGMEDASEVRDIWLNQYQGTWWGHLSLIASTVNLASVALLYSGWKTMQIQFKLIIIANVGIQFLNSIATGSRAGAYSWIWVLLALLALARASGLVRISKGAMTGCMAVMLLGFLAYSSFVTKSRYGMHSGGSYLEYVYGSQELSRGLRADHPLLHVLPRNLEAGVIEGSFYFGHGYSNLAEDMLHGPVLLGFGIGHSYVAVRILNRITGQEWWHLSRPLNRIFNEQNSHSLWYTGYMWIASDVTYFGVPLVMWLFGYIFGTSWRTALEQRTFMAALVFLWMLTCLTLMHNTYIVGDYGALIMFYGSIIIFITTHKKIVLPIFPRIGGGSPWAKAGFKNGNI